MNLLALDIATGTSYGEIEELVDREVVTEKVEEIHEGLQG